MTSRGVIESTRTCNARKKQDPGYCHRPAGWGTWHPGAGRCKLHGGATPIKHGVYSRALREYIRLPQFEAWRRGWREGWEILTVNRQGFEELLKVLDEFVPEDRIEEIDRRLKTVLESRT